MGEVSSPYKGMPKCWEDDKRMNALFLPFRDKRLNPVDWQSKMKFWRDSIDEWTMEKDDCILSVNKLQAEFRRKDRIPMCLASVLQHLLRVGDVKERADFASIEPEQSWSEWAMSSFVKTPIVWSFTKLREALIEIDTDQTEYVYLKYLKVVGEKLLSHVRCKNRLLLSLEEVSQAVSEVGHQGASPQTVQLVVHQLRIERKAVILSTVHHHHRLVKFSSSDDRPPSPISEAEAAVFHLEQTRSALANSVESLHLQIQRCVQQATNYLKNNMRQSAKSCLRKKRDLEKCIEERLSALDNTNLLISRIHDSESDAKVIEAYRMGLTALKTTFKKAGLSEDSVLDTMAQVQEVIDIQDEIQTALSESVNPMVDDDELERELSDLMATATDQLHPITDLPDVPSHPVLMERDVSTVKQRDSNDDAALIVE